MHETRIIFIWERERDGETDIRGEKDTLQKFVVNRRALVKFSAPSWVS